MSPAHTGDENPTHGLVPPDKPFEWAEQPSTSEVDPDYLDLKDLGKTINQLVNRHMGPYGNMAHEPLAREVIEAINAAVTQQNEEWRDRVPAWDNEQYREALTIWAARISAQVRNHDEVVLFHYPGAPRSTEDGKPFQLNTLDSVLLRDLLNAATTRGYLPKPEGLAAEDAIAIGSRPTFVTQVANAYQQGARDTITEANRRAGRDLWTGGEPGNEPWNTNEGEAPQCPSPSTS